MFLDPETSHFPSFYCKRPDTPYLRVTYIMEWVSRSYFFVHLAQTVKNLPANQETWFQPLGQEDPLEKGMATHSNILAWRIPWTEEPGGVIKSQTWLSDSHLTLSSFLVKASLCWAFDRGADRASVFRLCNREKKNMRNYMHSTTSLILSFSPNKSYAISETHGTVWISMISLIAGILMCPRPLET